MTSLKTRLSRLASIIAEEASNNPDFAMKIEEIIGNKNEAKSKKNSNNSSSEVVRKGGRRTPAVIDPVSIAQLNPEQLRKSLSDLSLSQLLDIVAEYGMDPGKLVMKWKDQERVIDRIIELSMSRATKGDAFRSN